MLRLFIAIWLPAEIIKELQKVVDEIRKDFPYQDARFTTPEQWHLTLVFLGSQPETAVEKIRTALKAAAAAIQKVEISFEKITYGPSVSRPRMIWLNTTLATSKNLDGLKQIIEKELTGAGIIWAKENRPFHGHLTLARFLPAGRQVSPRAKTDLPPLETSFFETFTANEIHLMQSRLKPTGAVYEELGKFPIVV